MSAWCSKRILTACGKMSNWMPIKREWISKMNTDDETFVVVSYLYNHSFSNANLTWSSSDICSSIEIIAKLAMPTLRKVAVDKQTIREKTIPLKKYSLNFFPRATTIASLR